MHANTKDLTGKVYGKLTVVALSEKRNKSRAPFWICSCSCGSRVERLGQSLKNGSTLSCGCNATRHGHSKIQSKEYMTWKNLIQRCYNENHPSYPRYGARGIIVHPEWRKNFVAFYEYVGDSPRADYTIERLDNEKGYVPGNVVWASRKDQSLNRSTSLRLQCFGETIAFEEAVMKYAVVDASLVRSRLSAGWKHEEALTHPKDVRRVGKKAS